MPKLSGVVGFFKGPHELLEAAYKAKAANYKHFDAHSPFPIHGMDDAMGLKRSFLPYITFVAGLTGGLCGFGLQYWTSAVNWPLNVGGKPFNSWPAFIPVTFELTVLFAGLSTVAAMFVVNGLPNIKKRALDPGITRDKFALIIETPPHSEEEEDEEEYYDGIHPVQKKTPETFDAAGATDFLKKIGASDVRTVQAEGWF